MEQPAAGPSRSPDPIIRQPDNGSSDDMEEIPLAQTRKGKGRSRAKSKTSAVVGTDPAIDLTPVARSRRIPRTSTSIRHPTRKTTTAQSTSISKSRGKAKEVERDRTILVEESTDEDEPEFVGASIAKKLASKFTFQSNSGSKSTTSISSSSSSSSVVVVGIKSRPIVVEDDKPQPPPLPLLAPLERGRPPPVPAWLGRTAVLLQIPYCVVCRVRWKKENGAARWVSPGSLYYRHRRS